MFSKELLLSVMKPARYIGQEINVIKKDLTAVDVKVCLCFPDIYEIGMSHLGLRILYDIINRRPDCAAERVFSPWVDMEVRLREGNILLSSIESGVPVKDFDILGFSLQYELSYTNVLNILSLAGIPLKAGERGGGYPLVIAGGPCALNPEPVAEFIDLFVVGEAEEVIGEILEAYKKHKALAKSDKAALLEVLSGIGGVYCPALELPPGKKIAKRFVKDLNSALDLTTWIVPYIEIVHDRVGVEIMRGCPNACRFCQARSAFYPLRIMSAEKILEVCRRLHEKTGYEEMSLLSLSSSDHPELNKIITSLVDEFRSKGVSISLPSVRAKHLVGDISRIFSTMRKTSLTFAPEAGSERLRQLLRKNIDLSELFEVSRKAYESGYRLLKLYFMIGLPTETDEDLEAIVDICSRLSLLKKEVNGSSAQINVSISNFIPKPHTPFEKEAMASRQELSKKQEYLRRLFKKAKGSMRLSFHDADESMLEAVLARGDRRLGAVILSAFQAGAKFDAWDSHFNFSLWQQAFETNSIDQEGCLKEKDPVAPTPWDFIDLGFTCEVLHK